MRDEMICRILLRTSFGKGMQSITPMILIRFARAAVKWRF